ncbi:cytochrome C [Afipia sp. Root123D2]|uniref:c-type cytochrome n=1 Tax=Afipia sp. Root123D2 TaxID=1736436 RepID=UPI0006FEB7C7|nr:cytochrome c [Afipia sp. Root123D2]KQW18310.1 cytochrome C [Afipia sp. Root123D2]
MSRLPKLLVLAALGGLSLTAFSLPASAQQAASSSATAHPKKLGLGRVALPEEIKAWDTDVRPDGLGLPVGKGTVKEGDALFQERCASCHGEFGEGAGRWPVLAGGQGSLKADRPDKTIGSFWPDLSTVFDYIRRAMPFGNAQSLTDDEAYALTAYLLSLNDIVKDENFELNNKNFTSIKMPNASAFYDDDREVAEKQFWEKDPCMKDCRDAPKVVGRAMAIDVTPDSKEGPKVE